MKLQKTLGIDRIRQSAILRSVVVLMTGAVVAQVINLLFSPVISRLFSVEDIAELGVYMRASAFVSAIATAKLELGLPLDKLDRHSFSLYRIALRIAWMTCVVLSFFLAVGWLMGWVNNTTGLTLLLSIAGSFVLGFINLGTNWSIRKRKYKSISWNRMINSLSSNVIRVIVGLAGLGAVGLIVATIIGSVLSALVFLKEYLFHSASAEKRIPRKKAWVLLKMHRDLPLINLPHSLIDLSRELLITFFILSYYDKVTLGSFVFAQMILSVPMAFIGQAFAQVLFNQTAELAKEGKSILPLMQKTFRTLFVLALPLFTLLFFFGQEMMEWVFGQQWTKAGQFAEILTPLLFVQLLVSPLSNIPIVLNKQKEHFYLATTITGFQAFVFGLVPLLSVYFAASFESLLWLNTGIQIILFTIYLFIINYYARYGVKH